MLTKRLRTSSCFLAQMHIIVFVLNNKSWCFKEKKNKDFLRIYGFPMYIFQIWELCFLQCIDRVKKLQLLTISFFLYDSFYLTVVHFDLLHFCAANKQENISILRLYNIVKRNKDGTWYIFPNICSINVFSQFHYYYAKWHAWHVWEAISKITLILLLANGCSITSSLIICLQRHALSSFYP